MLREEGSHVAGLRRALVQGPRQIAPHGRGHGGGAAEHLLPKKSACRAPAGSQGLTALEQVAPSPAAEEFEQRVRPLRPRGALLQQPHEHRVLLDKETHHIRLHGRSRRASVVVLVGFEREPGGKVRREGW